MKYTFVVTCNSGYLFGLNATINAAKFFGTGADFTIISDDITEDIRNKYKDAFPFKVNWVDMEDILKGLKITSKYSPYRFWITSWILGARIIDDYDSICILQADEFLCTGVNNLFKIAALTDIVIATEYTSSWVEFEALPFGTTKSIWNRSQYALYDQLVFLNKKYKQILIDTYEQQCVDPWRDEAQQPMCALNQACATYLTIDKVMGLDAHLWAWDSDICDFRLLFDGQRMKFYNERKIIVNGIHNRWWQNGVAHSQLDFQKSRGEEGRRQYDIGRHNCSLVRNVMCQFNDMTPETKNTNYFQGEIE